MIKTQVLHQQIYPSMSFQVVKTFKNNIQYIIGTSIICLLLWNRFFRIRLPRTLDEFHNLIFVIIFIGMCIMLIYSVIQIIKYKNNTGMFVRIQKHPIIQKILLLYDTFIIDSMRKICKSVILDQEYINLATIVELPLKRFINFCIKRNRQLEILLYIIFHTLPRIFVASIFIIDIYVFKYLKYFYYALVLLGIPLIFKAYKYLSEQLADINCFYFGSHLKIASRMKDGLISSVTYTLADEIPPIEDAQDIVTRKNDIDLLNWLSENYNLYSQIKSLMQLLTIRESVIKPYENLYVYSCYALGWGYILYINLEALLLKYSWLINILNPQYICPFC